jgi:hypothetical protein
MMQPSNRSKTPAHNGVIDSATLYLCRQGRFWVAVIDSPRATGAMPLRYSGRDSQDAQFEVLTTARRACPDAAIMSTDGALAGADYEWRIEVRGIAARTGELGVALQHELSADAKEAEVASPARPGLGRRCHWGLAPSVSGRPRTF